MKFQCLFNHYFIKEKNYSFIQGTEENKLLKEKGRQNYPYGREICLQKCTCKLCGKAFNKKIGIRYL